MSSVRYLLLSAVFAPWASQAQLPPSTERSFSVAPVPTEIRTAEGFDVGESAGVFVGVRHFKDGRFPEVPYAVDDAIDLAYLFTEELKLILPSNVVLATAGEPGKSESKQRLDALLAAGASRTGADQSEIYDLLDRRGRSTGPGGLFIVAMATHGFTDPEGEFLLGADSLGRLLKRTGIAAGEVFDLVAQAAAPRRIVLIDACRERRSTTHSIGRLPDSAMSQSFVDAIAEASGQVVLFGATRGGFAYDDLKRGNGVFAAAVMDGLRGHAPADERSFITARTLADYVNRRVLDWVHINRPEHAQVSQGISSSLEGTASRIPLAVNPFGLQNVEEFRHRRRAALELLRENLHGFDRPASPVTGVTYDQVLTTLSTDYPSQETWKLLEELERLNGSLDMQRSFVYYFQQNRGNIAAKPATASWQTRPQRRTAAGPAPRPGARFKEPITGIELVYRPPGTSTVGSPRREAGSDTDETQHQVALTRGFFIADREVTRAQFARFVAETGHVTGADHRGGSIVWEGGGWRDKVGVSWRASGGDDHPVTHVSWNDAQAFCAWLSRRTGRTFRLPTEAEWELAARAGSSTATYAGDLTLRGDCEAPELDEVAWYCGNSGAKTWPVGRKTPNTWGLYDMLGNASEWVGDWFGLYPGKAAADPTGPTSGEARVVRGGSAYFAARTCRAAARSGLAPGVHYSYLGFRVVME